MWTNKILRIWSPKYKLKGFCWFHFREAIPVQFWNIGFTCEHWSRIFEVNHFFLPFGEVICEISLKASSEKTNVVKRIFTEKIKWFSKERITKELSRLTRARRWSHQIKYPLVTLLFWILSFCPSLQCRSGWWRHGRRKWSKLQANKNSTCEKYKFKLYAHWFFHLIRESTRLNRAGDFVWKTSPWLWLFPSRSCHSSFNGLVRNFNDPPTCPPEVCLHFVEPFNSETNSRNGRVAGEWTPTHFSCECDWYFCWDFVILSAH